VTSKGAKQVVRVTIVGEEYAIRSEATLEHTRAVAAHVDDAIRRIVDAGGAIETRKAAILAALQITDELFEARQAADGIASTIRSLSTEVSHWLPPARRGDGTGV
jgi:cell division protein ZapA